MAEAMLQPAALAIDTLQRLSKASGQLSKPDVRALERVCEIGKVVLQHAAQELVSSAANCPMLNSKSADGTPISVVLRHRRQLPSGAIVERSGRECKDFLIKNQFLRAYLPGGYTTRVVLQDPVTLTHGKSADAIFQACGKDWRSLRQMGHGGCAIEHYCYDRLGIESHERLWRQWHSLHAPEFDALADGMPADMFRLTEFVLVTACAAHDAQNAFRWAVHGSIADKDLLRDTYVSIQSLRNSMDIIVRHVAQWVGLRLSCVADSSDEVVDRRRQLWQMLDIDVETVEVLAETLQLEFRDGRLLVANSCSGRADLVDLVITALMSAWKFVRWSESRFLTVGRCSRTMVAALLFGYRRSG